MSKSTKLEHDDQSAGILINAVKHDKRGKGIYCGEEKCKNNKVTFVTMQKLINHMKRRHNMCKNAAQVAAFKKSPHGLLIQDRIKVSRKDVNVKKGVECKRCKKSYSSQATLTAHLYRDHDVKSSKGKKKTKPRRGSYLAKISKIMAKQKNSTSMLGADKVELISEPPSSTHSAKVIDVSVNDNLSKEKIECADDIPSEESDMDDIDINDIFNWCGKNSSN